MTNHKAIICDPDGTLCNHAHRLHFVDPHLAGCHKEESKWGGHWWTKDSNARWEPDYESFHAAMDKDTVNEWCLAILSSMEDSQWGDTWILFVTGRPERYEFQTQNWIVEHRLFKSWRLFMRPDCLPFSAPDKLGALSCEEINAPILNWKPDHRPSSVMKREIYERDIKDKYDVLFVLEDDEDCAQMYKELGLTVLKALT